MREDKNRSLAYEQYLTSGSGYPAEASATPAAGLNITVVFTTVDATLAALRQAGVLAWPSGGRITLVVTQIIPYPLPLTAPPVLIDWNERRFRVIAAGSPVETKVYVYLCRDRNDTLIATLNSHSVVVLGGRKRWWPTSETRLARALRRAGHEVIFTETD